MDITCVDMGGSNIRVALLRDGQVVGDVHKQPVKDFTNDAQVAQVIADHAAGRPVSICCAGDIDEPNLVIKYSSNVPYAKCLEYPRVLKARGLDVVLTNDMRAAVMAEAVYGAGKGHARVAVATFSSGTNCAVADNKKVVTSAEFGHIPYKSEGGLFCGCGAHGHIEPYVSGNGAAAWAKQFFSISHQRQHLILASAMARYRRDSDNRPPAEDLSDDDPSWLQAVAHITSADVYAAFAQEPDGEPQRSIRAGQVTAIAHMLAAMIGAYHPLDVIVLMGSQTNDWEALFAPAIQRLHAGGYVLPSMPIPQIVKTALPDIGLQGAAAYYLHRA